DRAPVFTAAAVAEAPDLRVGVCEVVDRATREESALAAVEFVGPIARELQRRLIFEQPELVPVPLTAELTERVDDARLERRHVPRRIGLVAEAVDVGAEVVPEPESSAMVAVGEPARMLGEKVQPARAPVRVRLLPDPFRVLNRRPAGDVEAVHL